MRKFLLTLSFIIFANPVFADDIPEKKVSSKKLNIQISISDETTSSLEKITKNFNKFRNDNICTAINKDSSIKLKEDPEKPLTICENATLIKDIYNCVCETTGNFYIKLKPIIEFKSLSANTNKKDKDKNKNLSDKFQKLKEYYDALDSMTTIQQLSDVIRDSKAQHQQTQAELANERERLIKEFTDKLKPLLTEERNRRNTLNAKDPDIVKNLTCNDPAKCLEKHNETSNDRNKNANIEKWVANNGDDNEIDNIIKNYIEQLINSNDKFKDVTRDNNENLQSYITNDDTSENNTSEIAKTKRNIEKLKSAEDKDTQNRNSALDELAKEKDKERNLIKQIIDTINSGKKDGETKITADLPESITTDNCNRKDTNDKLNNQLTSPTVKGSQTLEKHPSDQKDVPDAPQAKTAQDIKKDTERTHRNNEKLLNRLKEIQTEQVNKKFDRIKELLHQFNMKECTIYGQIDDIVNQRSYPFTYNRIGASGTRIEPLGEEECKGLSPKTITAIQAITNTDEKDKWLKCLDKKALIIDNNITSMNGYIEGLKEQFKKEHGSICDLKCKYEDEELTKPLYSSASDLAKYSVWYETSGDTKPGYKNPTNKITIEKQVLTCEINSYQCPDRTITLSEDEKQGATSTEDLRKLCEKKKLKKDKENYKNNYDCKDDKGKSIPATEITKIKNALNTFDKDNTTLAQLQAEGERLCADANEKLAKQRYIDTYTCDGIDEGKKNEIKAELQGMLDNPNTNPKPTLQALKDKGTTRCAEEQRKANLQKVIDEFTCTDEDSDFTEEIIALMLIELEKPNITPEKLAKFGDDECTTRKRNRQLERERERKEADIMAAIEYLKQNFGTGENDTTDTMCKAYNKGVKYDENEENSEGHSAKSYNPSNQYKPEKYNTNYDGMVEEYANRVKILCDNNIKLTDKYKGVEILNNYKCRGENGWFIINKVFSGYMQINLQKTYNAGDYCANVNKIVK